MIAGKYIIGTLFLILLFVQISITNVRASNWNEKYKEKIFYLLEKVFNIDIS